MLQAGRGRELKFPDVDGNPLGSGCEELVAALVDGRTPVLECLRLEDTGLDDNAVRILAAGIRSGLPQLHALECRSSHVGAAKDELRAAMAPSRSRAPAQCIAGHC